MVSRAVPVLARAMVSQAAQLRSLQALLHTVLIDKAEGVVEVAFQAGQTYAAEAERMRRERARGRRAP